LSATGRGGAHGARARIGIGAALAAGLAVPRPAAAVTLANLAGEVERITLDPLGDHYAGGTLVVRGQVVIVPRNLLVDPPANRLTLQELFLTAPPDCAGNTGLAKSDPCLLDATGAFATVQANRSDAGNVIAGAIRVGKGLEAVVGDVTCVDHTAGFLRVNGVAGDPATGDMIRLNDPTGRHTIQQGPGCAPGSPNCSADPRFGVDPDNHTAAFIAGYPMCIPSTALGGARTVGSDAAGVGDPFCPDTDRAAANFFSPPPRRCLRR